MPRIRQYAERDAMMDFAGEINAQRARHGLNSSEQFGDAIGVAKSTAWRYLKEPGEIRVDTLRSIVKAIKPNPAILLKALGYTTQDLKKLAKEYS